MSTKLVDTIVMEKESVAKALKEALTEFLQGGEAIFEEAFKEFETLLEEGNWIEMEEDFCYDHKIKACWYGLCNKEIRSSYKSWSSGTDIDEILKDFQSRFEIAKRYPLDLPTRKELTRSLSKIKEKTPFSLSQSVGTKWPSFTNNALYAKGSKAQGFYIDYDFKNIDNGRAIPLVRLTQPEIFEITDRQAFFRLLLMGFVPKGLDRKSHYKQTASMMKGLKITTKDSFVIKHIQIGQDNIEIAQDFFVNWLLYEDKIRADLAPYHKKILEDISQGHWSLWEQNESNFKDPVKIKLDQKLVAKDPKSSVVNGVVGIDFGTKSTVVVYQNETSQTLPMRIGIGDLSKKIESYHYENPTVMECNDLRSFMQDYRSREGRPFTKWRDLTISHTAYNNLLNSKSDYFNAYITELKQWAGSKTKKLKIKDKKGFLLDLPEYANLKVEDFDPIETYAYYLGLYINNMHNGIYLNYILSFPVTYEIEIREKILKSFTKGIKKSLPQALHNQKEEIERVEVVQGASEPAAYAAVALQAYGFEPEGDERLFYGVFDFGGGTTDFDFGVFREAKGKKERRYDYTIEHFGAGGDKYLGGENLLVLLAFEIFKKNRDKLLEKSIQFTRPEEAKNFLGSENLISHSREAKMNTKMVMERLRPFWEGEPEGAKELESGALNVTLLDVDANQYANFELDVNKEELEEVLRKRIEKGVKNFFNSLRETMSDERFDFSDIKEINVFLAGNASKSEILQDIFDKEIEAEESKFKKEGVISSNEQVFKLFPTLSNADNFEKPNGKTGVAFGLIETRESGNIYVIDHNIKEDADFKEINFKYYLGRNRKKKFKVVIDREAPYYKWIEFIDASVDTFEVYYSSSPIVTTNRIGIGDESIKKLILKTDVEDEEASVFIRLVSPNEFEYVVAYPGKIDEEYLGNIKRVEI